MVPRLFMQNRNLTQIFFWPLIIGLLSTFALVIALIDDGLIEQIALLGLMTPITVIIYFYWIKE
jgi:di/tricarboxylate transporter